MTALTKITNDIYANMDNKTISLLTLCDLSKAFDSVNHEILLSKMFNKGILFFKDYLTDRTQPVRIGDNLSKKLSVPFDVP